jgi:pumilio homology domain family member 6
MRLLLHREASPVVADAYELYSNAAQRDLLLRDFYGKEVALFDTPNTASTDGDKKRGLQMVLDGADTERKKRILGALKDNLINV